MKVKWLKIRKSLGDKTSNMLIVNNETLKETIIKSPMFALLIQQNLYQLIALISGLIVDYKAQCCWSKSKETLQIKILK